MANTKAIIFLITFITIYVFFMASFNLSKDADDATDSLNKVSAQLKDGIGFTDFITFPFNAIMAIWDTLISGQSLFSIGILATLFSILLLVIVIDYVLPMVRGN